MTNVILKGKPDKVCFGTVTRRVAVLSTCVVLGAGSLVAAVGERLAPGTATGKNSTLSTNLTDSITYGSIERTDAEGQGLGTLLFTRSLNYYRVKDVIAPIWQGGYFMPPTNRIELATGDDGTAAVIGSSVSAATQGDMPYAIDFNVPIRLESDLRISNADGTATHSDSNGRMTSHIFGQPISEDATPRKVVVENGQRHTVAMFCASNTFSGGLEVKKGVARAGAVNGVPDVGTQFGSGPISITGAEAALDLNGNAFPETLPLTIAATADAYWGQGSLVNNYASPIKTAEWKGPVTLAADATVGGAPYCVKELRSPFGYGDIAISGAIGETDGAKSLSLVAPITLTLSNPNNTFSGGLNVRYGTLKLSSLAAAGKGPVTFASANYSGAYDHTAKDAPDISLLDPSFGSDTGDAGNRDGATFTIVTGEDDYHPAGGFTNITRFAKVGPGALVITNRPDLANVRHVRVEEGDFILDTTGSFAGSETKMTLSNNARFILRNAKESQSFGQQGIIVTAGTYCEFINESSVDLYNCRFFGSRYCPSTAVMNYVKRGTGNLSCYSDCSNNVEGMPGAGIAAPNLLFNGETWMCLSANKAVMQPFTSYAAAWNTAVEGVSGPTNAFVDVTEAIAGNVPNFSASGLRFNTPVAGKAITLDLTGTNFLYCSTILITPAMSNHTITITGGAMRCPLAGFWGCNTKKSNPACWRFINLASNATLRIESNLLGPDLTAATTNEVDIVAVGPGKTVLRGKNELHSAVYIIGGELDIEDSANLGIGGNPGANDPNSTAGGVKGARGSNYIWSNGGILTVHGKVNAPMSLRDCVYGYVRRTGGALNVVDADGWWDFAPVAHNRCLTMENGAVFRKTGSGAFKMTSTSSANFVYGSCANASEKECVLRGATVSTVCWEEGAVLAPDMSYIVAKCKEPFLHVFSSGVRVCTPADNTLLKYSSGMQGTYAEYGRSVVSRLDGTVTVDLAGKNTSIGTGDGLTGGGTRDQFVGSGDMVVTNSGNRCAVSWNGGMLGQYTGTFSFEGPVTHDGGLEIPNGGLHLGSGSCYLDHSERFGLRFGRLSGDGAFKRIQCGYGDAILYVGCDDGTTTEFSGQLLLACGNGKHNGSGRLVKIGNNAWKISGKTNLLQAATMILDGDLLLGTDVPGVDAATLTSGFTSDNAAGNGCLSGTPVYLGGSETPAGAHPRLLTDGAFTIAGTIKSLPGTPADVVPAVGGKDGSTYTGDIELYHDLALYAESGRVTFSGKITDVTTNRLSVCGNGEVVLAQVPDLPGGHRYDGTALVITDANCPYVIDPAATLDLDLEDLVLDSDKRYAIIRAAGGVSGRFATVNGLPGGWHLSYVSGGVYLVKTKGTVLYIR